MSRQSTETAGHDRVRASKHGYLVSSESNWQGAVSGRVLLVRYCKEFPAGMQLWAPINETSTEADRIAEAARAMLRDSATQPVPGLCVIRRGHIIQ